MKLCIVTHSVTPGDGQGRVNYEIAQAALRRGHALTILASHIAPELQSQVQWVPIAVGKLPTEFLRNLAFARQSDRWLHHHRHQYDLVLSNGAITPAPSDINTAHFVHSTWLRSPYHTLRYRCDPYGLYQWLYTALNARWEKRAFARSKTVVAVSEQVRTELESLGLERDHIQVILNGVDPDEFAPAQGDRAALGLPQGVLLGLFAGDIRTPRKNLDTVLQAMVAVSQVHLAVAGDATGSPFVALAHSLGLGDRVHFLGYRRDMAQLMQGVDFFVFPSRYETFGLVVLEAMASGLPVITAATTGAAALVTPDTGFVLGHPDDIAALQAALAQMTDAEVRSRLGTTARQVALRHTWATMAQQYVDLAEEICSQQNPTPGHPSSLCLPPEQPLSHLHPPPASL